MRHCLCRNVGASPAGGSLKHAPLSTTFKQTSCKVAQWQSGRLLSGGVQVRVLPLQYHMHHWGVAQWKSSDLLNRGARVRILSPQLYTIFHGGLAQQGERLSCKQGTWVRVPDTSILSHRCGHSLAVRKEDAYHKPQTTNGSATPNLKRSCRLIGQTPGPSNRHCEFESRHDYDQTSG